MQGQQKDSRQPEGTVLKTPASLAGRPRP